MPNKGGGRVCSSWQDVAAAPELQPARKKVKANWSERAIARANEPLDYEAMIAKALSSEHNVSSDIRIDDSDIPRAANFFEFATDKNFLGVKPYAKQLEIAIGALSEYCPRCSNRRYIRNIPVDARYTDILENVTLLVHEHCPRCRRSKAELVRDGELCDYHEIAICAGQRGGKSAIIAMMVAYLNHCYLKLESPAAIFGELPGETLYANFTALNLEQVTRSLWRPIQRHLARSPWYRQYHEFLTHHGNRLGQELFHFKETFVHYRHKGLYLGVKTPDRRTLRGSTAFMGGIDELGLFDANNHGQVKFNAQEIYTSMANSFSNLRGAHRKLRAEGVNFLPPPMFMNISSPMNKFDKITRLVEENADSEDIFVRHYATWEMNPKITRRSLQSRFDANPAEAMRDFGAVPPLSTNAFFNEAMDFKPALDKTHTNAFICRSVLRTNEARKQQTCGKLRWYHSDSTVPKLMTLDAGSHNNSFAITVGHVDEEFGAPVVDAMAEITPLPNCPINFNDVYENVLVPIIERMNIRYVAADRWQSKKLLDDLEAEFPGLITEVYSIKYGEMEHFRQDVWDGRITFPWPELKAKQIQNTDHEGYPQCFADKPVAHFMFQAITVQDYQGKSVEKGEGLTDDLFRSTALFHAFAVDDEIRGLIEGEMPRGRPASIGVVLNERQVPASVGASRVGVVAHGAAAGCGRPASGLLVLAR